MKGWVIWVSLFLATAFVAWQFVRLEGKKVEVRQDLATLQDMRYGLFNVDEWKRVVAEIITEKVESFDLSNGDRYQLQKKIEGLLYSIVGILERNYYEKNSKRLFGFVKNIGSDLMGVFDEMRGSVPDFSTRIINFLDEPKNQEALRVYLIDAIDDYAASTFGQTDYSEVDDTLQRRWGNNDNRSEAIQQGVAELQVELTQLDTHLRRLLWIGLFLFVMTVVSMFQWIQGPVELKLAVLTLAIWLGVGVSMPLLLIDARIDSLEFQLVGHPVVFVDQVLFFQSKSIYQVVELLVVNGKGFGTFLAGAGVFLFSVVVPLAKLGATFQWNRNADWTHSWLGKAVLFKSSKWAMADVMVVAIFLSNLGFNGVLKDQLGRLEGVGDRLEVLTTAASTLLPGFLAFFGFALLSILLSTRVHSLAEELPKASNL